MREVFVAGASMTDFGRFQALGIRDLAQAAADAALRDADAAAGDVSFCAFGNAVGGLLTGQECVRGQVALRGMGFDGASIINVENACASSSSAFHLAWLNVASGQCDVALAVGAEKMSHPDRMAPMRALEAAADLAELDELKARIGTDPNVSGGSVFMDLYADLARRYMERSGATAADFGAVSAKSRAAGALNPHAQFRIPVSVQQVLSSRMIANPLTLMMCSPTGDGAAALVLMSGAAMRRRALAERPRVLASVVRSGRGDEPSRPPVAQAAAQAAYEAAAIGPEELDVVELHDAAAPAELMLYEQLGLTSKDNGAEFLRTGSTALAGRIPVNPSGGLLSKGHPIGATGCAQLVELSDQLRGRCGARQVDGARVGLAENGGGWIGQDAAAAVVTILVRD